MANDRLAQKSLDDKAPIVATDATRQQENGHG